MLGKRSRELDAKAANLRASTAQPAVALSNTVTNDNNYRPEEMATGRIISQNLVEHQARKTEEAGELDVMREQARRFGLRAPTTPLEMEDFREAVKLLEPGNNEGDEL